MEWQQIRECYPDQWLVVQVEDAQTDIEGKRHFDRIAVVDQCPDGGSAFARYRSLHKAHPDREYYFVHTSRSSLVVEEEKWLGVRIASES
jgi:hypothetical protein